MPDAQKAGFAEGRPMSCRPTGILLSAPRPTGRDRPGRPARFRDRCKLHEVGLQRIGGMAAQIPSRHRRDRSAEDVALFQGGQVFVAYQAAHLSGLAVIAS